MRTPIIPSIFLATCSSGDPTCLVLRARDTNISCATSLARGTVCKGKDLGESGGSKPAEIVWRGLAPEGKLDLVVALDSRMSTSCLYFDIVLPTATWIHPLSAAVDPVWESRSDWETYKTIARRFSELALDHLGKKGKCELIPGVTAPQITVVERDYPNTYHRFTSLGPLADTLGNGGKGIKWGAEDEVRGLGESNYRVDDGKPTNGRPRIDADIDAAEVIHYLAPETNGPGGANQLRPCSMRDSAPTPKPRGSGKCFVNVARGT